MITFDLPMLEEDSEDLTTEEVESAIPVINVEDMLQRLRLYNPIEVTAHALRRCAPFFYGRVNLNCTEGPIKVVFRLDWLGLKIS